MRRVRAPRSHRESIWPNERQPIVLAHDAVPVLVQESVMPAAEHDEILQRRLSPVDPVLDVVCVDEARVAASGKAASTITDLDCSAECRRDRASQFTNREWFPRRIVDDRDERPIAAQSLHRGWSDRVPIDVTASIYRRSPQHRFVDMHVNEMSLRP